jgi:DNA-binding transcriptional LysR family regulator
MELRHLRYLIAVSEETTFVRAAERLHIAQPALSKQIHNFEKELGTPVFARGRTGVTLTAAGAIAVDCSKSLIDKVDRAVIRTRMADAGRVGRCRIYASVWGLWTGFSGRLVAYLAATEPDISVSVEEAGVSGHWEGLSSDAVDLAISTKPPNKFRDLESEPLIEDSPVVILARDHPLAGRRSIQLKELKDELLLLYDSKSINRVDHDLFAAFDRAGFKPAAVRDVSTSEGLIAMVAGGVGWSMHRRSLMGKIPSVAMIPIEGFHLSYPVALVHRKKESRPVVLTVARRIRELAKHDYPDIYVPGKGEGAPQSDHAESPLRPWIEFRDLRYFATVVEKKSIGQAAESLGKSQPAVSRQITHLERDLGVKLFIRTARGITPTAPAQTLYEDTLDILEEVDRLPSEVARGESAIAGRCTIAAVPPLQVRNIIATAIQDAARHFPHIDILPSNVPTPRQPALVQNGEFDIGLCHPFSHLVAEYPDLDCREILSDVIDGALIPIGHPLAGKSKITFAEIGDFPFLFFPREFHPGFYDFVMATFTKCGYTPVMGPRQDGLLTIWSLAAAGKGWSFGFGSQGIDPPPGLVAVPIEGFSIPWGVDMLTRKHESRPTVLTVISLLSKAAAAIA